MTLENQALGEKELSEQIERLAREILEQGGAGFWKEE